MGETIIAKGYGISCELGEIHTRAHKVESKGRTIYNSGTSFFEKTESRESFRSIRYKELELDFATNTSVRTSAQRLNRIRLEDKGAIATSYRNHVEREGAAIQECIEKKCEEALLKNGFDSSAELCEGTVFVPEEPSYMPQAAIEDAAINCGILEYNATDYELPGETVNISIDDVCVNRQTETRPTKDGVEQLKRVNNTVIHVESRGKSYILNAASLFSGFKLLIGLLLTNGSLGKQLVIFADGARTIHNMIPKILSFANCKVILDWYHLKKKCKEQLSMALKGSKIRNAFLDEFLPCLWFGNVGNAVRMLQNIDTQMVKNHEYITKLIEYLQRVRACVPCYALRKELGLRNSSNMGEKANDIVVSNRQKHNGMSWSNDGSIAFATIAAATYNDEINRWICFRDIDFMLRGEAA